MKYATFVLLFLMTGSCRNPKVLSYEEGMENCVRIRKQSKTEYMLSPDCLVGAQIPDFEANTLAGSKINREGLKGKISIINFWFTSCAPCVAEIPGLNAIAEKYGTDVNCIAIGRDDTEAITEFLRKNPWTFEQIPDGSVLMHKAFQLRWGFPTTFLLNRNAEIILAFSGGRADSTAVEAIQKKLIPAIEKELR